MVSRQNHRSKWTRPASNGPLIVATAVASLLGLGRHSAFAQTSHYPNGLAQTPAMGWSSWSALRKGGISETVIKGEADFMHANLQSHGWQYINIDDGWFADANTSVDQYGRFTPDLTKFPNGMKAVADYVHSLGLKFGIYLMPGIPVAAYNQNTPIEGTSYHARDIVALPLANATQNSALPMYKVDFSKPGAQQFIQGWANQMAAWGVDYVKMDWINVTVNITTDGVQWSNALLHNNLNRPIYLQFSNNLQLQGTYGPQVAALCNAWRGNPDIEMFYGNGPDGFGLPIVSWIQPPGSAGSMWDPTRTRVGQDSNYSMLSGPGGWNDLDSLEIGWGPQSQTGLTQSEKQIHYAFWSICCSPLLLGCDLLHCDSGDLQWLQNDEIIAVDQDPVMPKYWHMANQNWQVYAKPSQDNGYYLLLMNADNPGHPGTVTVDFAADLGLSGTQTVRDLFAGQNQASGTGVSYTLDGHTCVLLKIGGTPAGNRVPGTPSGVAATGNDQQIVVSWNGSAGAATYNIYRSTSAGGEGSNPYQTGVTATSFADNGLTNGTTYYYKVSAVNSVGQSPLSAEVSAVPAVGLAIAPGTYKIVNHYSGLALDDPNGASGAVVDQQAYSNANQQWSITAVGGGYYKITSASGLVLGGPAHSQLSVSSATGANDQQWSFHASNGSFYTIKNRASGNVIDLFNASTSAGAVVGQWDANAGWNQDWSLTAISTSPTAPAAPTGLTAAPGNAQVTLTWNASSGATSYNVFRNSTLLINVTSTNYTNTGLTNGTAYSYQVSGVNSVGQGPMSAAVNATPSAPQVPGAPTGVSASAGNTQVSLTWNAVSGATSYNLYRNGTKVKTGLTGTSVTDTGLANGTSYAYQVSATNAAGEGAKSATVNATPIASTGPITLSGSVSGGTVSLSWTSTVPNVAYYTVYRGTTAGGEGTTPLDYPSATSWTDNFSPVHGTSYYYVVRAVDIYGNTSAASNEVKLTP